MGLFGFLKKEQRKEFPAFPKLPQLPKYESPLKEFKPEPLEEPVSIPIRKTPVFRPFPSFEQSFREEMPVSREAPREPIYVKLSKYREAVKLIKDINARLQEAEKILSQLTDIKEKENTEIEKWQEEITSIKNKLMEVDKNLFEA